MDALGTLILTLPVSWITGRVTWSSGRAEVVHTARMSHALHYVLVHGDPEHAGEWAEHVPDFGVNYDWMVARVVIRPDGTSVKLLDDGGSYADYPYESLLDDLRRTIAGDSALSLPVLDESSSPEYLRDAASVLLRRASAREALDSCGSPDLFDPFAHEYNAWEWGQLGVTHPDSEDDDRDRWLLVLDFHS